MDATDAIWKQVVVDRGDSTPPYQQIASSIRHKIAIAQLEPGTPLPSIRQLAAMVAVTTSTVSRAYRSLQDERLVETHAGVGTVVADVVAVNPWSVRVDPEEELRVLVGGAVGRALEMGYGREAILQTVQRRLGQTTRPPHVLFVCAAHAVAVKYELLLSRELGPLGMRATAALLSDMQRDGFDLQQELADVSHVVTMLSFAHEVESFFHSTPLPISVLLTELSLLTSQRLRDLKPGERVAFVAEPHYRTPGLGLLQPYCRNGQLTVARTLEVGALARILTGADVVVHTLGTSDVVSEVIGPQHRVIELEFQVREDSLRMLKENLIKHAEL